MDDLARRQGADPLSDPWELLLAAARSSFVRVPRLVAGHPAEALFDLYGPLLRRAETPFIVGHLGQSLDGFIATESGDSCFVTGRENILHLHRMRALFDAVIVGAGTVAADDPRLTTREVSGPHPLRVVLDPQGRLAANHRVFTDGVAPTLWVCQRGAPATRIRVAGSGVERLDVAGDEGGFDLAALVATLRARGLERLFVEGGGRTVSSFLRAGLMTRLQVTVAPMLIGAGRPSMRLPGTAQLAQCLRAPHRVFRMGPDLLFELDLAAPPGAAAARDGAGLARVI